MGALSIRSNHCVVLVSSFWFPLLRMCWHEDSGEIVCYMKGPLLLLCGWPAEVRGSILPLVVIPLCCQASCALVWMSQHIALVCLLDCMHFLVITWVSPTLLFLVLYVNIAYVWGLWQSVSAGLMSLRFSACWCPCMTPNIWWKYILERYQDNAHGIASISWSLCNKIQTITCGRFQGQWAHILVNWNQGYLDLSSKSLLHQQGRNWNSDLLLQAPHPGCVEDQGRDWCSLLLAYDLLDEEGVNGLLRTRSHCHDCPQAITALFCCWELYGNKVFGWKRSHGHKVSLSLRKWEKGS